jgi:hypothetical protein
VRAWCRTTGHELAEVEEAESARDYVIRKASEVREQPAWAMVISNPGLEELFLAEIHVAAYSTFVEEMNSARVQVFLQ